MTDARHNWQLAAESYAAQLLSGDAVRAAADEALHAVGPTPTADSVLTAVRDASARRVPPPPAGPPQLRRSVRRTALPHACPVVPELLAARAASRLSHGDLERLANHLEACPRCRAVEDQMALGEKAFRDALADDTPSPVAPPDPVTAAAAIADVTDVPARQWVADGGTHAVVVAEPDVHRPQAWLGPKAEAPQVAVEAAPDFAPDDWLETPEPSAEAELAASRRRHAASRATRIWLPAVVVVVGGGVALAAAGVFDASSSKPTLSVAPLRTAPATAVAPKPPATTSSSAARDKRAAERRRRQAAARRRAAARAKRRAAAVPAPARRVPVRTTAPAPAPAKPSPTKPAPSQPAPAKTTTPDSAKPSTPSSEPGRQPPPTG